MPVKSLSEQIWEISQKQKNQDGFTVYTYGLDRPVDGYSVAYSDTQNKHDRQGLEKCIEHAQTHAQVVGGWTDSQTNTTYFDSVRVLQTEKAAVEAAIIENQIAYYDISGKLVIIMREETNGKYFLLPKYQQQLGKWNEQRKKRGMEPLKIYG